MEYRSPRHREILTECKLWPYPFDTDQVVSDNMKSYEKNTSVPVFVATRFLYSIICYTKVTVGLGAPDLFGFSLSVLAKCRW